MRKFLVISLLFISLLFAPAVQAQAVDQTAIIQQLLALVQQLTIQLQQLLAQQGGGSGGGGGGGTVCPATFTRDLTVGSTGEEVLALRKWLVSRGEGLGLTPKGGLSTYFDVDDQKLLAAYQLRVGISPANGYFGPVTRAHLNSLITCPVILPSGAPVITGVSGPTSLKVGELGTWTVKASDPNGGTLSYSVNWGEPTVSSLMPVPTTSISQTATFTHAYTSAGTFTPTFTVTNQTGRYAKSSISVRVGDSSQPSITVLSPNGGEVWEIGSTQTLKWTSSNVPTDDGGIIYIQSVVTGKIPFRRNIAVNGGSLSNNGGLLPWSVSGSAGQYRVTVCSNTLENPSVSGKPLCDISDDYFTIASAVTTKNEQKALATAREVIEALSVRDYQKLEGLVSSDGLSLDLYPRFDLKKNLIPKSEVSEIPQDTRIYLWGYTDGKGDPINLTRAEFLTKWIYSNSVDYLKAPEVAVNKKLGGVNSVNTIEQDVVGRAYVAFHFPGFNSQYPGTDWTTLYLIFDSVNGEYKLRGIAKDNWTI